jgi:hypothetical protein
LRHHKGMHVCQQQNTTKQTVMGSNPLAANSVFYMLSPVSKEKDQSCSRLLSRFRFSQHKGERERERERESLLYTCSCTQRSVTKLNVYLFHRPTNIWGQYCLRCRWCHKAHPWSKKKRERRERQDCQCAGWVHSPPVDPETKRCGWHPPTAERPSPEIEGAWRLEKATAVMDKLLRQIRCS